MSARSPTYVFSVVMISLITCSVYVVGLELKKKGQYWLSHHLGTLNIELITQLNKFKIKFLAGIVKHTYIKQLVYITGENPTCRLCFFTNLL